MTVIEDPAVEQITVRLMQPSDLARVVRIDAAQTGRPRPRYFELMFDRAVKQAGLQVSLVADVDGFVAGYVIASLYYGEYGITEPTASIDAIGVEPALRRHHLARAMFGQLRRNLAAVGATSIRTEVDWNDFDLLGFLHSEHFVPAPRICVERKLDPGE